MCRARTSLLPLVTFSSSPFIYFFISLAVMSGRGAVAGAGGWIHGEELAGGRVINVQLLGIMSSASVLGGPRPAAAVGGEGGRTRGDVTTWGSPPELHPGRSPHPPRLCEDLAVQRFWGIPAWDITPRGTGASLALQGWSVPEAGVHGHPSARCCRGSQPRGLHPQQDGASIPSRAAAPPHGSSRSPAPQPGLEQEEGEGEHPLCHPPGRERGWSCCSAAQSPGRGSGCARGEQGPSLPPRPLLGAEATAWGPVAASGRQANDPCAAEDGVGLLDAPHPPGHPPGHSLSVP